MESQILSSAYIGEQPRWDFRYFEPKYLETESLLDAGKYPVDELANYAKRIANFGAYSLCNLLAWVDDGVPYIRVTDLREDGIAWETVPHIPPEIHAQLPKSKVYPGDVLYSMAGTIGLSAIAPDDLGECNSNQAVAQIQIDGSSDLSPHYLTTYLNSRLGRHQSERIANGQTVLNINLGEIGKIRIPLPPRPIQDRIAQIMQDAYAARREMLAEAEKLLDEIDEYMFETLGLVPESVREEKRFLRRMSGVQGGRFDVDFNMGFHKFDPYPDRVSLVQDVALFPKETKDPSSEPDDPFKYIDISSIDIETGEIAHVTEIMGAQAPSRARQIVHADDIIVSTVRPTRGATALVPADMDGFICSTGFTIVRSKEKVLPAYLHVALRLSTTREQFGRRSTGSSYPAILEDDVRETLIPVPDKKLQGTIIAEVEKRRAGAKHLRAEAETLVAEAKARVERMILGEEAP